MAQPTLTPLPPAEAIAALQRRGQRFDPTFSWQDAWQAEHAAMFTVAKSAGFDILKDIHGALVDALAQGRTFQDFAQDLRPVLEAKGWWGRKEVVDPTSGEIQERTLGSTRRLRTIFETNMRVSYASGHWEQFERNKRARPVLRYVSLLVGKDRRKAHLDRHNLCLPVDDPYWDVWGPQNGFGCQCTLQSLSLRDVERLRPQLKFTPPPETSRTFVNHRTGQITRVPDGIDPGWAYNPGKAGWRASVVAQKLSDAPPVLSASAIAAPEWPARRLADEFEPWLDRASRRQPVDQSPWSVGAVSRPVLDALDRNGVRLGSGAIAVDAATAPEILSPAVSSTPEVARLVRRLPETIGTAKAVLWDETAAELAYVFDVPGEDRARQLVVRVALGSRWAPNTVSATRLRPNLVRSAQLIETAALAGSALFVLLSGGF
ncbi:phage head morphogenesis protein [Methylobacterium flocculans]|uniref:phage head morphogenesis protein n=1 Tax=Methylobacterium flocculans TaxID=2984843 RepID=UPI0021F38B3C|nr:phage minor head protein [Methylobacterium sp. FF17]